MPSMPRKQYIVMWPVGGSLASTIEDHNRIVKNRQISHLIILRPGMPDITADSCLDNFLRPNGGRISFDGITDWLRNRGWDSLKRGLPFAVQYYKESGTLNFTFIGDRM